MRRDDATDAGATGGEAPAALIVSPHLDDAAFSCAEPMLGLRRAGWRVDLATVFTATMPAPKGFALACQLDKGLAADVDYMALRRAEDRDFAGRLGIACHHLDLPEAPHRGYGNVVELFGDARADDPAFAQAEVALRALIERLRPQVVFGPLGAGGHVDHRIVVASLRRALSSPDPETVLYYAEQPYASRRPHEADAIARSLEQAVALRWCGPETVRTEAIDAVDAYATQLGFQFGGPARMRAALSAAGSGGTRLWRAGARLAALDPFLHPFTDATR